MIFLKEKKDCCGCQACQQKCPQQCIKFSEDKEGFLYPVIDTSKCIDCGICEKVCPVINKKTPQEPVKVYAAQNPNEQIRLQSSSGGAFTLLAESILREGGVVFGARFDENWEVKHDYAEDRQGLAAFRGSKYVQSRIGDNYKKAASFLKQGRKVLFSGTPCQIAGLKKYLGKEYDNLLTVDFICHGVPSPKVWRMYLDETIARQSNRENSVLSHSIQRNKLIRSIEFRSKSTGWKKYSFALTLSEMSIKGEKNTVLLSSVFSENSYMQAFLKNLNLRPSCSSCPAKAGRSGSDITIADFWGIQNVLPSMDDDKGTSLLIFNTSGISELLFNGITLYETSIESVKKYNKAWDYSAIPHKKREKFFSEMGKTKSIESLIIGTLKVSLYHKIKNRLHTLLIKLKK